jgi:hypothetical protein
MEGHPLGDKESTRPLVDPEISISPLTGAITLKIGIYI